MRARAIPELGATRRGVHLLWEGPPAWMWSKSGWSIQRRAFEKRKPDSTCVVLGIELQQLRNVRELPTELGPVTLSTGVFPTSMESSGPTLSESGVDVYRFELDEPTSGVLVQATAERAFAYVMRAGKPVGAAPASWTGSGGVELHALGCDGVVLYAQRATRVRVCSVKEPSEAASDWAGVPFIAENLQMSLRQVWPDLGGAESELEAAKARILPDEALDSVGFENLAALLGPVAGNPVRPLDSILVVGRDGTPSEIAGLDVLRLALIDPRMRRVFAFGFFDDDPDLIDGETYEYRISGDVPASDIHDTVYGFHTVPSSTALPASFYLGPLRLRLRHPSTVELITGDSDGDVQVGRRGVAFAGGSQEHWLVPSLDEWSLAIDFPQPVHHVVLELGQRAGLEFAGLRDGAVLGSGPMPDGMNPRLDFASTPIDQLRVSGKGILFAVRVSMAPSSAIPVSAVLSPVTFVDTPLPAPPTHVSIANLQRPVEPAPTTDETPRPNSELGFSIRWRPSAAGDVSVWPADADVGPPLDAAMFEIERQQVGFLPAVPDEVIAKLVVLARTRRPVVPPRLVKKLHTCTTAKRRADIDRALVARDLDQLLLSLTTPLGPWEPVMEKDGAIIGDRDAAVHDAVPFPGCDLLLLFPEGDRPHPGSKLDLRYRDIFGTDPQGTAPPLGSYYRYRVRARDVIDRPSATWTESEPVRLEKRVPPPLPAGPEPAEGDPTEPQQPKFSGVSARVLVRGAPDLTDADRVVLGDDDNAIVLRWGWHEQERAIDPLAAEFRVYASRHPMADVRGVIEAVDPLGAGKWRVRIALERAVPADVAAQLVVRAPTAFRVLGHTAGSTITLDCETHIPLPNGPFPMPALGPVIVPLAMSGSALRPSGWDERVDVVTIDEEQTYEVVLRNLLTLSETHPRDAVWVGVSSADAQSYVADTHPSAPPRVGNESNVVAVRCRGRLWGAPELEQVPPPLDPVPQHRAPEMRAEPVAFSIDLTPHISAPELGPGTSIRPERTDVPSVFRALRLAADGRVLATHPSGAEPEVEISDLNPDDLVQIRAALEGRDSDGLRDHHAIYLAGVHPYANELFVPASDPVDWGAFTDAIGASGRYVYRVRKAGAGGLSSGTAMAAVMVVVPSRAPLVVPRRAAPAADHVAGEVYLELDGDMRATHVAVFFDLSRGMQDVRGAELVRRPRAGALDDDFGLRLRTGAGDLVEPIVIDLAGSDVTIDTDTDVRRLHVTASGPASSRVLTWACAVAGDGVPSRLAGPWGLSVPPAPVPVPIDSAIVFAGGNAEVTWEWDAGVEPQLVSVERSDDDGQTWRRASTYAWTKQVSLVGADATARYRLRTQAADGRTDTVEIE